MNIAHVCQSYPPMVSGAAISAQRLASGQGASGHQVLVLAASEHGPAYKTCAGGVTLHRLRAYANPFRRGQRFVAQPGAALEAALREFAPDVVHLHDPLAMGLPGLRAARRLGVPVLLTLHALPASVGAYAPALLRGPLMAALWQYARALAARCDGLVAPSAAAAAAVWQHTGAEARVISNGVDLQTFTPASAEGTEAADLRRKYGLAEAAPIIITVGRLDRDKQVDVILRAFARVAGTRPAQLVVVGDGTQRAALMALSAQLGVADRVCFTGFVSPQGDLPGLYRLASAFVIASEVESEGMVVVEAAAAGVAVVAVRATSLPGLVEHGRTGWLVEPGDVVGMAERLGQLVSQPAMACGMGLGGRAKMARGFDFAHTVEAYERVYSALVGQTAQAQAARGLRRAGGFSQAER